MKDSETNVVYITKALNRYPAVVASMRCALAESGIEIRTFTDTKNIWCRDWAPAQVGDHFVKFAYKGYGLGYEAYPQLHVPESCLADFSDKMKQCDLIVDCGNVVRHDSLVLMTDIVYQHNPTVEPAKIRSLLAEALEAEIIFIPAEPGDDLGHTDGIVKWIDDATVFLNDYRVMRDPVYRDYLRTVQGIFRENGIDPVPFSYAYDRCPEYDEAEFRRRYPDADDMNPGFGYAINYLQVKGAILYPTFGVEDVDHWTEDCLWDAFPNLKLYPIDCADLSMEGGLVNCTTMNYVL